MPVYCRLKEIMDERRISVETLKLMTGLGGDTIADIRNHKWRRVSGHAMEVLCTALDVSLDALFVVIPSDLLAPIRLAGEVTIHYGSRPIEEPQPPPPGVDDVPFSRLQVGAWDVYAGVTVLLNYFNRVAGIRVEFREHRMDADGVDHSTAQTVDKILEGGNHILLGSQKALPITEELLCRAYDVPPYTPARRKDIPFGFAWHGGRILPSTFGWQAENGKFGVVDTATGRVVGKPETAGDKEGVDPAVVMTMRLKQGRAIFSRDSLNRERIVILLMGYTGAGTAGAARALTEPRSAKALYPTEIGKAQMRLVEATYVRRPLGGLPDPRLLTSARVVGANAPDESTERRSSTRGRGTDDDETGGAKRRRPKPNPHRQKKPPKPASDTFESSVERRTPGPRKRR